MKKQLSASCCQKFPRISRHGLLWLIMGAPTPQPRLLLRWERWLPANQYAAMAAIAWPVLRRPATWELISLFLWMEMAAMILPICLCCSLLSLGVALTWSLARVSVVALNVELFHPRHDWAIGLSDA